ncbi:MAG TPA: class I SAM-dependent methyltransferase [Planctomycetota bacterium]|nr:class I SAM-dependent methyltransferase [Planctomycetota bacterium]
MNYLDAPLDFNDPRVVDAYDELPLWSAPFGAMMLDRIPMGSAMTVLDVGCGTGFPLLELAGRLGPAARLVGIDNWHGAVERARAKAKTYGLKNVEIVEGDAAHMTFEDHSVDLITSNLGINNFADPDAVLRQCFRVLRPAGTLAVTSNTFGHMCEFYGQFARALPKEALPKLEEHIAHRSTPDAIAARIEMAGFKVSDRATDSFRMRFANGAALFNHYFIRLGFLPAWKDIVPERDRAQVFQALESAMPGEISLTIPCVYIAARK